MIFLMMMMMMMRYSISLIWREEWRYLFDVEASVSNEMRQRVRVLYRRATDLALTDQYTCQVFRFHHCSALRHLIQLTLKRRFYRKYEISRMCSITPAPRFLRSQILCGLHSQKPFGWDCKPRSPVCARMQTDGIRTLKILQSVWEFGGLFRYPFHTRVTAVARKRPRSFCQKCRWQVTAKHAYTWRMWLCMKWYGARFYGVHRTRRDGSSFMWHQPCQRCEYTTSVDIQKRAVKSYSLM